MPSFEVRVIVSLLRMGECDHNIVTDMTIITDMCVHKTHVHAKTRPAHWVIVLHLGLEG